MFEKYAAIVTVDLCGR